MMSGLLGDFEDPRQQGLLALGLGLLNSRGSFGQGLGQAGMQAMEAMRQATQDKQKREQLMQAKQMQDMQLQQAQQAMAEHQRAAQERERASQFLQGLPSPQMQANMQGLAGGGGPTVANAARTPAVDPMQQLMLGAVKAGALPLSSYITSLQKDETPMILPEGATAITRAGKTLATGAKKEDDFIRNMRAADIQEGSPQWTQLLMAKARKDATHAPAVSVSYGAPVAGVDPSGNPIFFQPDKTGGSPAIIPGVAPPKVDKPMPEAAQKQLVGTRNLQDAVGNYLKNLETWDNKKMLNPDARAGMGNAYNNMMLQAKEAYNLGVLNGPDYQILQSVVQDPTKPMAVFTSNKALSSQARELRRIAQGIEKRVLEAHGKPSSAIDTSSTPKNIVVDW